LLTCEPGALEGTRIEVEDGSMVRICGAGAPAGTTVEVRDLFWNVPARRKFLKRAQTEQAQCLDAVLRLALPRPEVTFVVGEGDRTIAQLHAGADVLPARADPAKAEVRFADAKAAWDAIYEGLTHVLARGEWMPRRQGATDAVQPGRVYALGDPVERVAEAIERYGSRMPSTWWMPPAHAPSMRETQPDLVVRPPYFRGLRYLGQLHRTYLVCEGPQGLVLVDRRAAHRSRRRVGRARPRGVSRPPAGCAARARRLPRERPRT